MKNKKVVNSNEKENEMSFFSFMSENYELSRFVLPTKKPANDALEENEKQLLMELMYEKDFYEINSIIKNRYLTS